MFSNGIYIGPVRVCVINFDGAVNKIISHEGCFSSKKGCEQIYIIILDVYIKEKQHATLSNLIKL